MILTVLGILGSVFILVPMITFPPEAFGAQLDIVFDVLSTVLYVLPAPTIFAIFGIVVAMHCTRIAIAFVKMIWELIPLL